MGALRHQAQSLSAFEATLPLVFTAAAIAALGFGAHFSGRSQPAPAEPVPVVSTMSKRQEAKLAADMSAFALTKVAPERLVSEATPEAFVGPALPPLRLATGPRVEAKTQRKIEKPVKVAAILPPPRPVAMTPSVPVATAHPAPERGVVARVAEYVPSPRQMLDGVWALSDSVGGQVVKYIPRI